MSTRGDDRAYKVVYASRRRDEYDDERSSRRPRRDVDYEDDYRRERVYRDDRMEVDRRSRASDSHTVMLDPATTRTRYAVGRDRNAESYVKRTDAVIIEDRPPAHGHGRYEYEVLRPQKRDDGAYIVDMDPRGYDRSRYEAAPLPRREPTILYESSRARGDELALAYRDGHREVQVTEEIEDDRYSRRGRGYEVHHDDIPPPQRLRSAIRGRNNTPPGYHRRASVGFYQDQISHHDSSESRHERPGAEAHIAGRYLEGNGQYDDDLYAAGHTRRNRSRSRSRGARYGPQRSDPRLHEYDELDDERRTFTEETMRDYEYEDERRPAYPPQRGHSRSRRHHRDYRDDDDERYSTHDERVVKKTTKEYYR